MRSSLLLIFTLIVLAAYGQDLTPYSRYGLGFAADNNHAQSAQMGGMGAAFQSPESPNYLNPASYGAMVLTTFDAGFGGNFIRLKTNTMKAKQNNFALNYLSIFVPVKKYWVTGVGLLPVSAKDYFVTQTSILDTNYSAQFEYEGSGNLYNAFWGNGFKYKGLYLGFNFGYMFGKLNNNTFTYLVDPSGSYDPFTNTAWSFSNVKISSLTYNLGAQYRLDIKTKKDSSLYMVFGISGSSPLKVLKNSTIDNAAYAFSSTQLGYRSSDQGINDFLTDYLIPKASYSDIMDTLKEQFGAKASIKLPGHINFGVIAGKSNRWKAGFDFKYQFWSKYQGYESGAVSKLSNSFRVGLGGEYFPLGKGKSNFFKTLKYRAGFYYTRTNITIGNQSINEFGTSFGIGIPLIIRVGNNEGLMEKYLVHPFNIGIEAGNRGTVRDNLIQETFIRLKFGVSLNDRWFVKRKYY